MEYPISIQEAIDELEAMREELIGYMSVVGTDAYDMAISALQKIAMLENLMETHKQSGHAPTRTISMEDLREMIE